MSRFLVLGVSSLGTAFERIPRSLEESASSLGLKPREVFLDLQKPLIKGGMGVSFILGFVEIIKEMPMALMIRPLGWDTLAVHIFQLTAEGEWEKAALPSLFIILVGFITVFWCRRKQEKILT